MYFIS